MNVSDKIFCNSLYLGDLKINDDDTMTFETPHKRNGVQRNRKFFYDLGDIVYFMFVDNVLMKIGKAAGKHGWYGRIGMYQEGAGPRGDRTNQMIIKKMRELGQDTINVFAIQAPRAKTTVTCPIFNETIDVELETASKLESVFTNKYLSEMNIAKLPFCTQ